MSAERIEGKALGVISDTHGSYPAWASALSLFKNVDAILHAGDVLYHGPRNPIPGGYTPVDLAQAINDHKGTILISRGNCDADVDQMMLMPLLAPYVSIWWNGKKILMMHGENFPLFRQMALDSSVDLAISGHTHVASVVREGGTIFMNPGSAAIPKGKDPASAATVDHVGINIMTLEGEILHSEKW